MAYLDWNPAFETGIPGIDYDHRRLVGLLNDIDTMIRDEVEPQDVAAALAEHGRAGVPLYLYYPADGGEAVVLPQVLSEALVLETISGDGR